MHNIDEIMKCLEDCTHNNNLLYNKLFNDNKLKNKIIFLDNDDSLYYFNIQLISNNIDFNYGLRIANQNNNPTIIDIILFRWNINFDISTSSDIHIKDFDFYHLLKFNNDNISDTLLYFSLYFLNNSFNDHQIISLY